MSLCDQQHLISGFQCHLDRANPSGDQPRAALHDSARQVHDHLLSGRTCKRNAVSHALADRSSRILCRIAGFRSGNENTFLPVYIVSRQLNRNDIPGILDAADQDIQTLSLYNRRRWSASRVMNPRCWWHITAMASASRLRKQSSIMRCSVKVFSQLPTATMCTL